MSVKEFYAAIGGDYDRALQMLINDAFVLKLLKKFSEGSYYEELKKRQARSVKRHVTKKTEWMSLKKWMISSRRPLPSLRKSKNYKRAYLKLGIRPIFNTFYLSKSFSTMIFAYSMPSWNMSFAQ